MYSVLDTREIVLTDKAGTLVPYKLVRLRDPWAGSVEWKGPCSDTDDEFWTTKAKEAFSKKDEPDEEALENGEFMSQRRMHIWGNKTDGVFAMLLEDFMQYFNFLTICRHCEDHRYFEQTYFYRFEPSYGALSSKTQ